MVMVIMVMVKIENERLTIKLVPACLSVLPKLDNAPTIDMLKKY